MKTLQNLAIAAVVAIAPMSASAGVIVDFDVSGGAPLVEGDTVGSAAGVAFDFGSGLTGTLFATNRGSGPDIARIFDTDPTTVSATAAANDPDLVGPFTNVNDPLDVRADFGNAIIIDEGNPNGFPDDQPTPGGTLRFVFDSLISLTSITVLDGEEMISLITASEVVADLGGGDNQFEELVLSTPQLVFEFTVDFEGSGAVGAFEANVVPLPASVMFLLSGLAGLGLLARRRRQIA